MAGEISSLPTLAEGDLDVADYVRVVDRSDTTSPNAGPNGTDKKYEVGPLIGGGGGGDPLSADYVITGRMFGR